MHAPIYYVFKEPICYTKNDLTKFIDSYSNVNRFIREGHNFADGFKQIDENKINEKSLKNLKKFLSIDDANNKTPTLFTTDTSFNNDILFKIDTDVKRMLRMSSFIVNIQSDFINIKQNMLNNFELKPINEINQYRKEYTRTIQELYKRYVLNNTDYGVIGYVDELNNEIIYLGLTDFLDMMFINSVAVLEKQQSYYVSKYIKGGFHY